MRAAGKATKTEKCLLGLTAAFLCLLAGLYLHDARQTEPVAVETERTVSREELAPDLSPLDLNTATAAELAAQGLTIDAVLKDNDAYHALQKTGGLIITGPTGTNVNDVSVALVRA